MSAPDATDARLIALRQSGLIWPEVAAELGLTEWKVWARAEALRKSGVPLPSQVARTWSQVTDWPSAQIATLRHLWAEGHTTAEIGRRMGLTKCAIVGKAHRLGLPARPSPINRAGEPRPARPRAPPPVGRAATLPPLASVQATPAPAAPMHPPPKRTTSAPAARPAMARSGRVVTCCWPIGEPGRRDGPGAFRFCDEPSDPGRPYCGEHCRAAYQPRQAAGAVA